MNTARFLVVFTQTVLDQHAGVDLKTVLDIEAGKLVRLETLVKVLRVMGMQLSIEPIVRVRPTLEEMVAMNEEENRREWELAMRQTAIGERSRNAKNK